MLHVSRPVDERRPTQLCDAIVQYLIEHGLADLSLRPLARAVGSSPRGLLYHFGSKEKMVIAVIAEIRRRQKVSFDQREDVTLSQTCRVIWQQISSNASLPMFLLFFEAYGIALRNPNLYHAFLHDTVEDWLRVIAEPLTREGMNREEARALASIVLAGLRGFMLDFCTTRDRQRLDCAVGLWAATLDAMLPAKKLD
jgi:AcrR family transcriptional regulator